VYLDFFGLEKPPFRITPDTQAFFDGGNRGLTLHGLCYAISNGEGIIKVVGEVGSGKTMLCRMLPLSLPDDIEWVYLAHPSLSPEQTLHEIARELGLDVPSETEKLIVMRHLHELLLKYHGENRQVVVLIEEAQGMPIDSLEEIRLLSNLETDTHKLLQIVMFGQPELDEKLANPVIRQLRERVTQSLYLSRLHLSETHNYLNFRLRVSGYTGPDLFSKKLVKCIDKYSHGLVRRINIIADKCLLSAYVNNRHEIQMSDVRVAALDCQYRPEKQWWRPWALAVMIFGIWFQESPIISSEQLIKNVSVEQIR
jgi:MSHA biogenesis protein MshM